LMGRQQVRQTSILRFCASHLFSMRALPQTGQMTLMPFLLCGAGILGDLSDSFSVIRGLSPASLCMQYIGR